MNISMHGAKIKSILWNGANGNETLSENATDGKELLLSATYHGDRDEFWVIVKKGDTELARHNCRYIASIEWA